MPNLLYSPSMQIPWILDKEKLICKQNYKFFFSVQGLICSLGNIPNITLITSSFFLGGSNCSSGTNDYGSIIQRNSRIEWIYMLWEGCLVWFSIHSEDGSYSHSPQQRSGGPNHKLHEPRPKPECVDCYECRKIDKKHLTKNKKLNFLVASSFLSFGSIANGFKIIRCTIIRTMKKNINIIFVFSGVCSLLKNYEFVWEAFLENLLQSTKCIICEPLKFHFKHECLWEKTMVECNFGYHEFPVNKWNFQEDT